MRTPTPAAHQMGGGPVDFRLEGGRRVGLVTAGDCTREPDYGHGAAAAPADRTPIRRHHISGDWLIGYGLKYPDGFGHTHLGVKGPPARLESDTRVKTDADAGPTS